VVAVIALFVVLMHGGYARALTSALVVGYLSHLAADVLTPYGLRLAWPLHKTWGSSVCNTGSPAKAIAVTDFCALAGFCLLHGYPLKVHLPHFVRQCLGIR